MVRTKWRVSFEWVNNLNERAAWCRCINGRRAFAKSISFSLQPDVHNNGQNWQAWFLSQTLHSLPTTRSCGKINTTVGLALSQWLGEEAQCSSSEVRHALEEQLADHKAKQQTHQRPTHLHCHTWRNIDIFWSTWSCFSLARAQKLHFMDAFMSQQPIFQEIAQQPKVFQRISTSNNLVIFYIRNQNSIGFH